MRKWKNSYKKESGVNKILKALRNSYFKIEPVLPQNQSLKLKTRELDDLTKKEVSYLLSDNNIELWDIDYNGRIMLIKDDTLYKGGVIHYDRNEKNEKVRINHIRFEGLSIKKVVSNEAILSAAKNLINSSSALLQDLAHESEEKKDYVFWNLSTYSFNSREIKLFVEPLIDYGFSEVIPKRMGVVLKSYF